MNYIQLAKTYCHKVLALFITVLLVSCGGGGGTASTTPTPTPFTPYSPALTGTGALNDTGITASQCYEANSSILVSCNSSTATTLNNAQDGMVGRDANMATNSSADGRFGFSFTTIAVNCVLDNVTGLTWEVKTTDSGAQDWGKTYTTTAAANYVAAVNAGSLCGHSDWRLPTADELQRIVDYSVASPGPTIDTTWFPNTKSDIFWSGSPYFGDSTKSWGVNFSNGVVGGFSRNEAHSVRLVRADM